MDFINDVSKVPTDNLCISCGICKGVCPNKAIDFVWSSGIYTPKVEQEKCNNCGICMSVCPGRGIDYLRLWEKNDAMPNNPYIGGYKGVFNAQTKDEEILQASTSGGIVTTLIKYLLDKKIYDVAFLPIEQCTGKMISSHCIENTENICKTCKSRYVPIEQSEAVKYIIHNREKKVILTGTSCFIQGIVKLIEKFKLNRNNLLLIGLFCDRNMNYNVFHYFSDYIAENGKLKTLVYRSKACGGWPGNICLELEDGSRKEVNSLERIRVKDYFQLERCLYCLDKLNQFADISVGDNYTNENDDAKGTSSVIIRTVLGGIVWREGSHLFQVWDTSMDKIEKSQLISDRKKNYYLGELKRRSSSILLDVSKEFSNNQDISLYKSEYRMRRQKLCLGQYYTWSILRIAMKIEHSSIRRVVLKIKYKLYEIKSKIFERIE